MNRTIALASATALLLVGAGCSTSAEPSGSTTGSQVVAGNFIVQGARLRICFTMYNIHCETDTTLPR